MMRTMFASLARMKHGIATPMTSRNGSRAPGADIRIVTSPQLDLRFHRTVRSNVMRERTDGMRDHDDASSEPGAEQAEPTRVDRARAGDEPVASRPPADGRPPRYDKVDDASDDSFPASDAPAWTGMTVG